MHKENALKLISVVQNGVLNSEFINPKGQFTMPAGSTRDDWARAHGQLMVANTMIKSWCKDSRAYGIENYGEEFVAEWEVQLEFSLGLPSDDTKETTLNPKDKSRVFVSIEGINQQFSMWQRKMEDEIPNWDNDKCKRALGLLEPIEQQAAKLRAMIHKATAQ
jgi:hypothetical protein